MRCPKCGAESELEEFICSNCQYRLKTESIERLPIFRRREETWYKADKAFKRILLVITNPSRAFWDINHKKDGRGPLIIRLLCGITVGLWALAIYHHMPIDLYNGQELTVATGYVAWVQGLPVFLTFFLFGFIYYSMLFWFFNFMFSIASNITVQMDDILRVRFNVRTPKNSLIDMLSGKMLRKSLVPETTQQTLESMKRKDFLTKISQTGKYKVMNHAYAPFVVVNLIGYIILLVSLPTQNVSNTRSYSSYSGLAGLMGPIFDSAAWGIIDFLQILTLALWIPITVSIALREIGNTNTTKLLIGNFIVAVLMAYMIFFLRPTLGWNLNIISNYGSVTTTAP